MFGMDFSKMAEVGEQIQTALRKYNEILEELRDLARLIRTEIAQLRIEVANLRKRVKSETDGE